jgi:integrase
MAEIKCELPFVHSFFFYKKMRHVFRRKGFPQKTIKGKPGSPEFMDHYHELLQQSGGLRSPTIGTQAGTIDALAITWYKHEAFTKGLAKATQATWRRIFDRFRQHKTPSGRRYGQNSIRTLPKKAIVDFLEAKDDDGNSRTANAKRNALKAIRAFIRFAVSQCELEKDPTIDITVSKSGPKSTGHMTWLEPQVAQYREHHPLGTMARLAIELLLNIAARREDAHALGQQHIRDGGLCWRPHKTIRSTGKMLSIPIMGELQEALDAIPATIRADGVLTFIVNEYGKPFASAAAFGNRFADWCDQAGLMPVACDDGRTRNYRAHGLRKAALRAAAHAGCTGVELMALGGHSSLKQVQEYIDDVDQARAAEAVMTKLSTARGTKQQQAVAKVNPVVAKITVTD